MPTTLREAYPTAKKEHICEFCACKIQPGQKYVRQTNIYDGTVYDFVTHQECKEVAHELRMYDGCDDSWGVMCCIEFMEKLGFLREIPSLGNMAQDRRFVSLI